jgi:hypothetical protein
MEPKPVSSPNNRTWIWVVVAVAIVLLLCLAVLVGGAAFAVWKGYIQIPGLNARNIPSLPSPIVPNQNGGSNTVPKGSGGPLTVVPYHPQPNDQYPTLQGLVPNWQNPTGPSTNTYTISLPASQPVVLATGWCTTTQAILDQNFQHIQYLFSVDGQSVNISNLAQGSQLSNGQFCRDYLGLIQSWPAGSHTIQITMRVDAKINDGISDYAAGDYTEIYKITVKP